MLARLKKQLWITFLIIDKMTMFKSKRIIIALLDGREIDCESK